MCPMEFAKLKFSPTRPFSYSQRGKVLYACPKLDGIKRTCVIDCQHLTIPEINIQLPCSVLKVSLTRQFKPLINKFLLARDLHRKRRVCWRQLFFNRLVGRLFWIAHCAFNQPYWCDSHIGRMDDSARFSDRVQFIFQASRRLSRLYATVPTRSLRWTFAIYEVWWIRYPCNDQRHFFAGTRL